MSVQSNEDVSEEAKKFVSPRGGFELNANPAIVPPVQRTRENRRGSRAGLGLATGAKQQGRRR